MSSLAGLGIDRRAIPLTITPKNIGDYNASGDWVVTTPGTPTTLMGVIQPVSGRQSMDMPEGIRAEAKWLVWSRSSIQNEDVISYQGSDYKVIFTWPRAEGSFYRAALGLLA